MACTVEARPVLQVDPVCSPSRTSSLRLDVPEWDSVSTEESRSTSISPGPQLDERSPDPRVYPSQWDTDWLKTDIGKPQARRKALPPAAKPIRSLKIWSLLKDWVGKDISRLSIPVYINEPICELQIRAEGFQNSHLLDQAAEYPAHSRERLLLVTAYSISIYSNIVRTTKPFKDLQNSTYEFICPERGYRLVGEKVAHTPATHCLMCEGKRWRFLASDESHIEFSLQCYIRFKAHGVLSVTFDDGDLYEWNQVPVYIQGLVMGPLHLDHKGQAQVICKATGNRTKLCLSDQGTFSRIWRGNAHQVNGVLVEGGSIVPKLEIRGKWDQELRVKYPDGSEQLLWQYETPEFLDSRFQLPPHALELNEIQPETRKKLPATDVRLRPDMRLFEDGLADEANVEKERLEEKARQARQQREAAGQPPLQARWFEMVPARKEGELPRWRFKGGYWESREKGVWDGIADLYGPGGEPQDKNNKRRGSMKVMEMVV